MVVEIRLESRAADDLARLSRKLKELGDGRIETQLRSTLRTAVTPVLRNAKSAARSLPSHQQGKSSLRADIARAMSVQVKLSGEPRVGIRISRKALGARASIPRLMNYRGGWYHPVFGHGPEVFQRGIAGWFDNVMIAAAPNVRRELEKRCKEFERRLMS